MSHRLEYQSNWLWILALPLALLLVLAPLQAFAAELTESEDDTFSKLETDDGTDVVYIPPVGGAPADRIGAGTRGANTRDPLLVLLAPKKGGFTQSAGPRLYWWLPRKFSGTVEVKVDANRGNQPPLRVEQEISNAHGLQVIDLSGFDFELSQGSREDGPIYLWRVMLKNSKGVAVTSKFSYVQRIQGVEQPDEASSELRAKALAKSGIWYDALAEVAQNPKLEKQRTGLLKSADLELRFSE